MTDMEKVPALSEKEREELLASLKRGRGGDQGGQAIDYDPKKFKDRLIAILPQREALNPHTRTTRHDARIAPRSIRGCALIFNSAFVMV